MSQPLDCAQVQASENTLRPKGHFIPKAAAFGPIAFRDLAVNFSRDR